MRGLRRCRGLVLVVAAAAGLAGCSRDKEVEAVLADLDGLTRGLVGKVKSAPNPQAGVAEAQRTALAAGLKTVASRPGPRTGR
jgi:hypothetical protein